jgi:hypothetical protein
VLLDGLIRRVLVETEPFNKDARSVDQFDFNRPPSGLSGQPQGQKQIRITRADDDDSHFLFVHLLTSLLKMISRNNTDEQPLL